MMSTLVLVLLSLLLLHASLDVGRALFGPVAHRPSRAGVWVSAGIFAQGVIVAAVIALGGAGRLSALSLGLLVGAVAVGVVLASVRQAGSMGAYRTAQYTQWRHMWALGTDLKRACRYAGFPLWPVVVASLVLLSWAAFALCVSPALGNNDALFYHEPIVAFTIQEGHLGPFALPRHLQRINGMPRFCHFTQLWFAIFSGRTFVEMPNLLAHPLAMFSLYGLLRKVGTQKSIALAWTFCWPLLPGIIRLTSGVMVDVQSAGWVSAAAYLVLVPRLTPGRALIAAVATALTVGTKYHVLVVTFALAVALLLRLLACRRPDAERGGFSPRAWAATVMSCAALILGAVAFQYLRNLWHFDNPIWPAGVRLPSLGIELKSAGDLKDATVSGKAISFPDVLQRWFASPYSKRAWGGSSARPEDYGVSGRYIAWPLGLIGCAWAVIKSFTTWRRERRLPGDLRVMSGIAFVIFISLATFPSIVRGRYWLTVFGLFFVAACWLLRNPRKRTLARQVTVAMCLLMMMSSVFTLRRGELPTPVAVYKRLKVPANERQFTAQLLSHVTRPLGLARIDEMGAGKVLGFDTGAYSIGVLWNDDYSNKVVHIPGRSIVGKSEELGVDWLFLHRKKIPEARQRSAGWEEVGAVLKRKGRHPGTMYRRIKGPRGPAVTPPEVATPPVNQRSRSRGPVDR